jgi:hypothetical protein
MMLAHVEAVKAQAVVKLGERKPLFVLLCEGETGAVVLIEDATIHDKHPFESRAIMVARV